MGVCIKGEMQWKKSCHWPPKTQVRVEASLFLLTIQEVDLNFTKLNVQSIVVGEFLDLAFQNLSICCVPVITNCDLLMQSKNLFNLNLICLLLLKSRILDCEMTWKGFRTRVICSATFLKDSTNHSIFVLDSERFYDYLVLTMIWVQNSWYSSSANSQSSLLPVSSQLIRPWRSSISYQPRKLKLLGSFWRPSCPLKSTKSLFIPTSVSSLTFQNQLQQLIHLMIDCMKYQLKLWKKRLLYAIYTFSSLLAYLICIIRMKTLDTRDCGKQVQNSACYNFNWCFQTMYALYWRMPQW